MDGSSFDRRGAIPGDGLVVATLAGLGEAGALVRFDLADGPRTALARSVPALCPGDLGQPVVLLFENSDPARPLIIGRLWQPPPEEAAPPAVSLDGDRVELAAEREVVLRCGKASLTLTRSGKIVLRGTYILSRSSGPNKIKGGSIQLN